MSTKLIDTALRMSRADAVCTQIDNVIAVGEGYRNLLCELQDLAGEAGLAIPYAIGDVIDDIHNMGDKLNDLRIRAAKTSKNLYDVVDSADTRDVSEYLKALPKHELLALIKGVI